MNSTKLKQPGSSNLIVRIAAAAVMVPVALFITWKGGGLFNIFIAILGVLMALEWVKIVHKDAFKQQVLHILAVLIAVGSVYVGQTALPLIVIAAITVASLVCKEKGSGLRWPLLGIPYISLSLMALVWLRSWREFQTVLPTFEIIDRGLVAVFTLFAAVWIADSLAYFAGRGIGGPKLWASVSPNKTWAGFFGAIVGGSLGAIVVFLIFGLPHIYFAMAIGAAIGGLEQGGDLLESAVKRKFDVKDSGSIIPGHGGVLDRVDGLMAASTAAWLFGVWKFGLINAAAGFIGW